MLPDFPREELKPLTVRMVAGVIRDIALQTARYALTTGLPCWQAQGCCTLDPMPQRRLLMQTPEAACCVHCRRVLEMLVVLKLSPRTAWKLQKGERTRLRGQHAAGRTPGLCRRSLQVMLACFNAARASEPLTLPCRCAVISSPQALPAVAEACRPRDTDLLQKHAADVCSRLLSDHSHRCCQVRQRFAAPPIEQPVRLSPGSNSATNELFWDSASSDLWSAGLQSVSSAAPHECGKGHPETDCCQCCTRCAWPHRLQRR